MGESKAEYIKKLQTMKLSEAIEEIYGIKLLQYQRVMVDSIDMNQKIYITPNLYHNYIQRWKTTNGYEEVYDSGYDTAGNYHMYGTFSGHTVIKNGGINNA